MTFLRPSSKRWSAHLALFAALAGSATAWAAPRDRTPPTTPTNLRVTGVSDYSVTLSWNPSTDDSGSFSYRLFSSAGISALVPQYYTSYTFTTNHNAGATYSFYVYAQDAAGNRSANSNTASATLLPPGTPPSPPVLTLTHVGPRHISVSWNTPSDCGPRAYFFLYVDGQAILTATEQTSYTRYFVAPQSTHTFTVQVRDGRVRYSAHSAPLTVTTPASDPNDKTPPSAPTNLWAAGFGDLEFMASWSPSTDNVTAQPYITYEVYVNGTFLTPAAGTSIDDYGVLGKNRLDVFAIDEAGNRSLPATYIFMLP